MKKSKRTTITIGPDTAALVFSVEHGLQMYLPRNHEQMQEVPNHVLFAAAIAARMSADSDWRDELVAWFRDRMENQQTPH